MKKIIGVLVILIIGLMANAQGNIGIGTSTPKAALNVAAYRTVLFGNDTSGSGSKMIWIPSKSAFRVGVVGPIPGHESAPGNLWDYDSIGSYSFSAGRQNKAKGNGSVAMGALNQTMESHSVALGYTNEAWGESSIALGSGNLVRAGASIALGSFNTASGGFSNVIGRANIAMGDLSTAIGFGVINNTYASVVIGSNNDTIAGTGRSSWVSTDPLFIIGGGQDFGSTVNTMTMLKNGKTGFGTNNPLGLLHSKHNSQQNNPQLMLEEAQDDYSRIGFKNSNPGYWNIEAYTRHTGQDNDLARLNFYFSLNGYIMSLRGNGNAVLTGTLFQNSDARLKTNITPLTNSLSRLLNLNGYTYQWKDSARGTELQVGLLAQEVEQQFPELVTTDEQGKKSVAYGNMAAVLLQSIKELYKQLATQQEDIRELKRLLQPGK